MNQNPYESPGEGGPSHYGMDPQRRTRFVVAAIGSGLASLYWAALTALIGLGVATGNVSGAQLILPCVLIALYGFRAFQIFNGDESAAKKVLWLHGVGGAIAVFNVISSGAGLIVFLQAIKVAIHIFGGVTAYRVTKS
jgi:hypothetical protein